MFKSICTTAVFVLCLSFLRGQTPYFRQYRVENGLSHNTVLCSLQDRSGFLWFGTKNGLNRFDGYKFKIFQRHPGKSGSLESNLIVSLLEDGETIWVGTDKGLHQYHTRTEQFSLVPATRGLLTAQLEQDREGFIWFNAGRDFYRLDTRNGKLKLYDHRSYFRNTSTCASPDRTVWMGTNEGKLKRYDPATHAFSTIDLFEHSAIKSPRSIIALYPIHDSMLLAATDGSVIKLVDTRRRSYTDILLDPSQSTMYIRCITPMGKNVFWFGAESGIWTYNLSNGQISHIQKDYNDPYSLSDNAVYTFCRDREGGLWIGSFFGGLNYYPPPYATFDYFFPKKHENSLSGNIVREIRKDDAGYLWIGTEDAGLNRYDVHTGKFTQFTADGGRSISFFNVHALLPVGKELWIGTFNHGLDVIDINDGRLLHHFQKGHDSILLSNFIYCLYKVGPDELLAGTTNGIYTIHPSTKTLSVYEHFPREVWYSSILKDGQGTIWASTFGKGIYFYNPLTGKSGHYAYDEKRATSLISDRVCSLFEDSEHAIWCATEEGLCKLDVSSGSFTRYSVEDGLPSNAVYCVLEDSADCLWISTAKGLVRFHRATSKMELYSTANGLLTNQFNYNSAFRDANGRMYFGCVKGLISFVPETFVQGSFVPPVYLTGFHVNGFEVDIGATRSPLKESISYTSSITLAHEQSTISIDFAALSFAAPDMLQYAYQMEGLSRNWVNLRENRRVDFVGLSPGRYTFRVRAFSNQGAPSNTTQLSILVLPPWWASRIAILCYLFAGASLAFVIARYYNQRVKERNRKKIELLTLKNEQEMLRLELLKEKELVAAKVEFFTNIAHEIKTPLTLIHIPLRKVIKKTREMPDVQNSLGIMERNTQRLIALTNQILDFRQIEINKFQLSLQHTDIAALLRQTGNDFLAMAEQKGVKLSIVIPDIPLPANIDIDAFQKIINNIAGNAIKYGESKAEITLTTNHPKEGYFMIMVANDGPLIPEDMLEKIFDPFVRVPHPELISGTGLGLALARSLVELHNGSLHCRLVGDMNVFEIILPVHPRAKL